MKYTVREVNKNLFSWILKSFLVMVLLTAMSRPGLSFAAEPRTKGYFHSGDGILHLVSDKNKRSYKGRYRNPDGRYDETAYRNISALFGVETKSSERVLSLRLIEYLDYLEDKLKPGTLITITSGYRPPKYNTGLRKRGGLAAKASLHQYGMAADFIMKGVPSKRIWDYVRALEFGGTGYYHGKTVHVDVGPARFWDEKTSGVGTGLSDDNKLIGLVADYDYFKPGDTIRLKFIRMTAFPVKVHSSFELISVSDGPEANHKKTFTPENGFASNATCAEFHNIDQMASFRWMIPAGLPPGRYTVGVRFCGNQWEAMPRNITTPQFEVRRP